MISYIKGKIEYFCDTFMLIDNHGMGYQVFASLNTINALDKQNEVKVFTYMSVREDSLSLYGFCTMEELNVFHLLIGVSGVGPKLAIAILNQLSPKEAMVAIVTEDHPTLNKCPGVGKKIAQRICLELKDKIKNKDTLETSPQQHLSMQSITKQDAIDALVALGYPRNDSVKVVAEIALVEMTTEQIIRQALKILSSTL